MIFHIPSSQERGFVGRANGAVARNYRLSAGRIVLGFLFLSGLIFGALLAHSQQWAEGSTTLLHMSEVAFGGIAGLIFGEEMAIGDAGKA